MCLKVLVGGHAELGSKHNPIHTLGGRTKSHDLEGSLACVVVITSVLLRRTTFLQMPANILAIGAGCRGCCVVTRRLPKLFNGVNLAYRLGGRVLFDGVERVCLYENRGVSRHRGKSGSLGRVLPEQKYYGQTVPKENEGYDVAFVNSQTCGV